MVSLNERRPSTHLLGLESLKLGLDRLFVLSGDALREKLVDLLQHAEWLRHICRRA
jgi:hypothetical protein